MYDTLRSDLITATAEQRSLMDRDPTYVVEKGMFLENAFPYLEVRRPFILGTREKKWKATIAHRFFELLHTKTDKLTRIYTQNIDGLQQQCTKIPLDKIINVHGNIAKISCEVCGANVDFDDFCDSLKSSIKDIYGQDKDAPPRSTPIICKACGRATVKPETVMFGASLPDEFFDKVSEVGSADLLIVAGTSLLVSPANSLVYEVNDNCIRMIVNREKVGESLGIEYGRPESRDCFAQGSCDQVFLDLADTLGWGDDLNIISSELPELSAELLRSKKGKRKAGQIQSEL